MRWREPAVAGLGLFAVLLAGCGSIGPPPVAMSCTSQRLPSGLLRVAVEVTNSTAVPREAVLYGPVIPFVRYLHPVLSASQVIVKRNGHHTAFLGLALPRIDANGTRRVVLRFRLGAGPHTLSVANGTTVVGPPVDGTTCSIGNGA